MSTMLSHPDNQKVSPPGPRLLVEASVLHHPGAGMARVLTGLYGTLARIAPGVQTRLLHRSPLQTPAPEGVRATRGLPFLTPRAWHDWAVPLAALSADAVHFPANGNIPRLWKRVPVITTLHDVLPLTIPGFFTSGLEERKYRERVRRDLERTDLLITDSLFSKSEILRHFSPRSEPEVLYPGVTLSSDGTDRAAVPALNAGYFLYAGGYHPRKGLPDLTRLFCQLRREGAITARLLIVGEPRFISKDFDRQMDEARQAGWVEERGHVGDAVLANLYRGALALLYPSRFEGFGLPPLEAMNLGCPVLTTRGTSLPEVCGEGALFAEPDSPAFAEAIVALETRPDLRRDLREQGLSRARYFSWEKSARQFLALLENLMGKGVK